MNKTTAAKILFSDEVEYTSADVESNKFLIYYRKNGELNRYELPLNFIKEFIYIDQNDLTECPICDSTNLLINEIEDNPSTNWECLSCGSNKESLAMEQPEIIPRFESTNLSEPQRSGNLTNLKIHGKRYLGGLHWFKYPHQLQQALKDRDVFETIPQFRYGESDNELYLNYIWVINTRHTIEDCRVCDSRYLRPPKEFNRAYLKYKYPDMWNVIDGKYLWEINNDCIEFQIKWDIEKYDTMVDRNL